MLKINALSLAVRVLSSRRVPARLLVQALVASQGVRGVVCSVVGAVAAFNQMPPRQVRFDRQQRKAHAPHRNGRHGACN